MQTYHIADAAALRMVSALPRNKILSGKFPNSCLAHPHIARGAIEASPLAKVKKKQYFWP
jgi:hypothetical protein